MTKIHIVRSSESFLQTSGQNWQLEGLDTQMLEARASVNSLGTRNFMLIKKKKWASHEGLPHWVFFPTATPAKTHLALALIQKVLALQNPFNSRINFFSIISIPPSAKTNQGYLWSTVFYLLTGDNIQLVITHLVWDAKLAQCRKHSHILAFMFNRCIEGNSPKVYSTQKPTENKTTWWSWWLRAHTDYVFQTLEQFAHKQSWLTILTFWSWQKSKHSDELSINTVQASVLSTQIW